MVRQIMGDGDLNLAFRRNFGMKETEGWEELLDKIEGVVLIVTGNVERSCKNPSHMPYHVPRSRSSISSSQELGDYGCAIQLRRFCDLGL